VFDGALLASFLCFVFHADNSFLSCKLAINHLVEWRHQINLRYFAHLLCIFGLPLVELFSRLLMLSVRWCFTCFVSLLCFSCRYLDSNTFDFVFCIRGFAFVAFLLGLVAYAYYLVGLFFFLSSRLFLRLSDGSLLVGLLWRLDL